MRKDLILIQEEITKSLEDNYLNNDDCNITLIFNHPTLISACINIFDKGLKKRLKAIVKKQHKINIKLLKGE